MKSQEGREAEKDADRIGQSRSLRGVFDMKQLLKEILLWTHKLKPPLPPIDKYEKSLKHKQRDNLPARKSSNNDEFVKSLQSGRCERSEAISYFVSA